MQNLNIEIKARCHNPERIEQILQQNNARYIGLDHQIDTYFSIPIGRFKLREGNIENSLIYYQREDQKQAKASHFEIAKFMGKTELKSVLNAALGIHKIVDKHRKIFFIDNVKFHIDSIDGLGDFVEIEAINENNRYTSNQLKKQCDHYQELLGIREEDLITNSYSDMV